MSDENYIGGMSKPEFAEHLARAQAIDRLTGQPFVDCAECIAYAERRQEVLTPTIVKSAADLKAHPGDLLVTFMNGVHLRHQAGLPL